MILFLLGITVGCSLVGKGKPTIKAHTAFQWIGNIDRVNLEGPSGIVYHSERQTLFVVGDKGDICEIQRDGALVKRKKIRHADFEGITLDPSSGLLYIAIEGEEKIIEVDPADFRVLREFEIDRTFRGSTVLKAGGNGIEALAFVPDSTHPEGGTFYIANQGFDLGNKRDPSAIFEAYVPLKSGPSQGRAWIIRGISLNAIDLSGLYHDQGSGYLYVISGVGNTLFELTRDGDISATYTLPGDNQEGITLDEDGFLYIAQDSGGIVKVKWDLGR
ncbi:MAG: SdiA-regulated domain-containing protein [Deltaproteobacteria bacterium]|nr:SdiA-regulated domain-containing protein [Deltaproteobacteria bacterium]